MNKLSKLTALLLALVLALSLPLQVMAESADTTVQDAIDTLTDYLKVADTALYDAIMAFTKYSDYWEIGHLLEDEDVIAYIANNDADRVKKIQDHLNELWWKGSVSYTGNPGPLMPPVDNGAVTYALRAMTRDVNPGNGLELTKTAKDNEDGTYTITLEAYAEGSVSQKVEGVPVDIVLVLDYSSSMTENFGGQYRIEALRTAVAGFIDTIKNKYDEKTANHRISIVLFDGAIHDQLGWKHVTGQYVNEMKNFVNNTATGSGTNPASGLNRAIQLFNDDYDPPAPTTRQKAVVLFTDGLPANPVDTNTINAITAANQLKSQDVTIYTVAVHGSADPSATPSTQPSTDYGSTTLLNAMLHAISSNYPTASASNSESTFVPCPHRKYGGRCYQGCQSYDEGLGYYEAQFTITYGNRTTVDNQVVDYYFSANNPADLNSKFENIAQQVQSGAAAIQLGSSTVVIDTVSQYFQLPANASTNDIKVYTQDYLGNGSWDDRVAFDADIEINGRNVEVSNFDYTHNFVAENGRKEGDVETSGDFRGRKLVIEFNVEAIPGFIGGNDVVTNDTSSGVYQPDGNGGMTSVESFPVPDVNVVFKEIHIQKEEQYIYLGNHANLDTLLTSFGITYTLAVGDDSVYEVNGYNNGYVMLRYKLTDPISGNKLYYTIMPEQDEGTWSYVDDKDEPVPDTAGLDIRPFLENDHTYNISYEVFAKEKVNEDGTVMTDSTGKVYEPETTGTLEATVYVFKPEVTFQDSKYKYMEQLAATDAADHYNAVNWLGDTQVLWKNPNFTLDLDQRPMGVMSSGPRPTLTFEYDIDLKSWINSANEVYTTNCVPVNVTKVTAKSSHAPDGRDVTAGTTSYRDEIECDCEHNAENVVAPATLPATKVGDNSIEEFVIHVYDVHGKLAISKTVENASGSLKDASGAAYAPDAAQKFTFTVTLKDANGDAVTGDFKTDLNGTEGTLTFNNEGVATVELLHGQTITIEGITNGMSYTVEETPVAGFTTTATVNGTSSVNGMSGNIVANATQNVAFTNTYNVGQLTVQKTITDKSGMYDLSGDAFTFTVTFSDTTNAIGYTIDGTSGTTTNGVATFTLTKDQTATFDRIPAGVTYTVTESTSFPFAGYTKGTETNTSGKIVANQTSVATVQNIYNTGTLTINKTGMDAGEYAVFNATVVARGVEQTIQVVVPNDGSAVIKGLDLGSKYEVTEVGDWTWRYTSAVKESNANSTIPTESDYKATVAFENTKDKTQWIDGNTYAENAFDDVQ